MKNIVLFLDVDGVLNQYNHHERIRRYKIHRLNNFSTKTDTFNPFKKKVLRLSKLVKKYNIDVYVFSAWTIKKLQIHLPFKLIKDTHKWACNVNSISKNYRFSVLIDDEVSSFINKKEIEEYEKGRYILDKNIITYQPNYKFGLVKKDFIKLDRLFKSFYTTYRY